VKWNRIWCVDFFEGVFRAYLIGLLTLAKNVYGTKETFAMHDVDMDKEIRLHGGMCILGGMLGALPSNIVMSFTCTAKKMGILRSSAANTASAICYHASTWPSRHPIAVQASRF